ncbi:uncharacterized protein LOC108597408 [Drosophila busckii]|uniref:uncharacterized protein LOC108597408 n=1 Tax=Drosophila busckii TaxID=30019 RepID=UPI00083ECFB0|nr:uncharacterized protein LOC108597408 [Drosophila busckii]
MKTIVLSPDDLQNFNKFIYDPKSAAQLAASAGAIAAANHAHHQHQHQQQQQLPVVSSAAAVAVAGNAVNSANKLMALHYYLNQQGHYVSAPQPPPNVAAAHAQQQQLLAQSQTQLKQLQLKQPTIHQHQQQHLSYHHHPYYQQQQQQPTQQQQQQQHQQSPVPVHALNQNSNFSAASSSTGGTGSSSHAPTQQSNGSSVSPTIISHTPAHAHAHAHAHQLHHHPHHQHAHHVAAATLNSNSSSSNIAAAANALLRASAAAAATAVPASPAPSTASSSSCASNTTSASAAASTSSSATASSTNCAKKLKTEPLLSQYNQTERLNFANTYIVWSEEHWRRVIFHDERRFNLDGPDGFSYYFHDLRNYERTLSQRPRGNSVYIYLMISVGGAINLEVSSAKQRPESCIEAILRERPNIISKLGGSTEFVLQDHNWTAHALPSAQELLNAEGLKSQKWPTIAHDLNIMENIWGWLIREVFDGGRKFSRKDDLIFRVREAWSRLPLDLVTNLYSTLPERITELYYTQGAYTNC